MLNLTQLVGFGSGAESAPASPVVGAASGVSSLVLPEHQAGDLLVGFAFRDGSTTAPSLPSGWTNAESGGANSCSVIVATKVAASSGETSGTWSNATALQIAILRGVTFDNANAYGAVGTLPAENIAGFVSEFGAPANWLLFFIASRTTDNNFDDCESVTDFFTFTSPVTLLAALSDATNQASLYIANKLYTGAGSEGFVMTPSEAGTSTGYYTVTAGAIPA
jgi:hypothetical protein